MDKTIYISIPSLYDEELFPTIVDAFEKAENPDRVFIGVSLADATEDMLDKLVSLSQEYKNLKYKFDLISKTNTRHLRVGYGRLSALSMYSGEDYVLQTDSHAAFGKNWDTNLIALHKKSQQKTKNDKVVLTGYAGSYAYSKDLGRHLDEYEDGVVISGYTPKYPVFVAGALYNETIPSWTVATEKELKMHTSEELIPSIKFNANFAFSDKQFVETKTISEDIEFFEEELTQTILLIENGFSLVFPNVDYALVCHLYAERTGKDDLNRGVRRASETYEAIGIPTTNSLAKTNYLSFVSNKNNSNAIKRYQQYAKMNMRIGPMKDGLYIPKYFINSEGR